MNDDYYVNSDYLNGFKRKVVAWVLSAATAGFVMGYILKPTKDISKIVTAEGNLQSGGNIYSILEAEGLDVWDGEYKKPLAEIDCAAANAKYWLNLLNPDINDYNKLKAGQTIKFLDINGNGKLDGPVE